eukprot:628139_1
MAHQTLKWTCDICTYNQNKMNLQKCEICSQPRTKASTPIVPPLETIPSGDHDISRITNNKDNLKPTSTEICSEDDEDTKYDIANKENLKPMPIEELDFTKYAETENDDEAENKMHQAITRSQTEPLSELQKIRQMNMTEEEQMKMVMQLSRQSSSPINTTPNTNKRKRKRMTIDDHVSPLKKRKTSTNHAETQTKHRIDNAYRSFLNEYVDGKYAVHTVVIEFGPKFKGRSKHFTIKDIQTFDNDDLPNYTLRIKHYKLEHDKKVIPQFDHLDPGNHSFIYSNWVMVRLDYKSFINIWSKAMSGDKPKSAYGSWEELIMTVKNMQNVKTVLVALEGVEKRITKQQKERIKAQLIGSKHEDTTIYFNDPQMLRDAMNRQYLKDKSIHFEYFKNQKQTAAYVKRAAKSLAKHRFQKLKKNPLSIERDKPALEGNKSAFYAMLINVRQVSPAKAEAIVNMYPMVGVLMNAYRNCVDPVDGELLLQDIAVSNSNSNKRTRIGPSLSKKLYHIFYS